VSETFDLYCSPRERGFRPGQTVTLDGVDGFFDQYFQGVHPGDTVRFAVVVAGPEGIPTSVGALESIPFVTARVLRSGDIVGEVEILSSVPFVDWMRSLTLDPEPLEALQAELSAVPLSQLVEMSARTGAALWATNERRWRTASDISMVYVERRTPGLRIAVMRTNASPGFVTHVETRKRGSAP
jgi:hypothetical protein